MSPALRPAFLAGAGMVLLGVLLLLHALGVLPGGIPVGSLVVIAVGVVLLLNAGQATTSRPAAGGALTGSSGAAQTTTAASTDQPRAAVRVDLGEAASARVVLNHGAGVMRVGAGAGADSGALIDGHANAPLEQRVRHSGDRIDVSLQPGPEWQQWPTTWQKLVWELSLVRDVPVDLEVKTGASHVELDLSELTVRSLKLQTGASDVDIVLPGHGQCHASITAGAADIRMRVPEGVAASVRNRSALAGFAIDEARFPRTEGRFESPDFAVATDRVTIDVDGGLASFAVI